MAEAKGINPEITTEVTEEVKEATAEMAEEVKEAPSKLRQKLHNWKPYGSVPASSSSRPLSFKGAH
jgi:SOS response regulatory protein OraA/RecX